MEILADSIKCNGCVNNIKVGLKKVDGVSNVSVDIPTGKVEFDYDGAEGRKFFVKILDELGFPEKGKRNRFKIFGR